MSTIVLLVASHNSIQIELFGGNAADCVVPAQLEGCRRSPTYVFLSGIVDWCAMPFSLDRNAIVRSDSTCSDCVLQMHGQEFRIVLGIV